MSATTFTAPKRAGAATTINRHLKGEWTKLRTLPSTWRTAALAGALAIGFTGAVDLQQASLTAQQREIEDVIASRLVQRGVAVARRVLARSSQAT